LLFLNSPINTNDSFHVTLFRAWPHPKLNGSILRVDGTLRMGTRKLLRKDIVKNPDIVYNKKPSKKT